VDASHENRVIERVLPFKIKLQQETKRRAYLVGLIVQSKVPAPKSPAAKSSIGEVFGDGFRSLEKI
jgi:hypothetical protein